MDDLSSLGVPAHVPPGLIHDYDAFTTPGPYEWPQLEVARDLFRSAPPIFYTPRNGGHWVVTRTADILEMCRDPEKFSSNPHFNYRRRDNPVRMLPAFYDPPEHTDGRKLAAPLFTPGAVKGMEDQIRALARGLVDAVHAQGRCNFIEDIAQTFPVMMFLRLADGPLEDRKALVEMANRYTRGDKETSMAGMQDLSEHIGGLIDARRDNPGTDLISRMVAGTLLGEKLTYEQARGAAVFMFMAGLDTVASMMSFIQLFLARHPEHYRHLVENPERIGDCVEELMRVCGVVVMERGVRTENVYKGITFKQFDRILLLLPISGMDDEEVDNPEMVDFSRSVSKHLVFGTGIHRCLGSHLARTEIRIFLEEWTKRIPHFRIATDTPIHSLGGTVWCPDRLPLEWEV